MKRWVDEKGIDPSKELDENAFAGCDITTANVEDLKAHFHIIGVPTDIDENYLIWIHY
jgi:hypothetical protein